MPTTPEPLVFGRVYPRRYLENDGQSKLLLLGKQSDQDIRNNFVDVSSLVYRLLD